MLELAVPSQAKRRVSAADFDWKARLPNGSMKLDSLCPSKGHLIGYYQKSHCKCTPGEYKSAQCVPKGFVGLREGIQMHRGVEAG